MTQSPLQEAIAKFEGIAENEPHSFRKAYWTSAAQHLKLLLPKEREFVEKVFQAGADWATEVLDSYVRRPKEPDINQFIENLYKSS